MGISFEYDVFIEEHLNSIIFIIFLEIFWLKILIFCMMVEHNIRYHLRMIIDILSTKNLVLGIKGPTRGYWIPISREKFCHIPKSSEKLSIFLIPNFPPCHPVEYFFLDWKVSLKQWQLSSSSKILYHDVIGAYQVVLDPISVRKISPELFVPTPRD